MRRLTIVCWTRIQPDRSNGQGGGEISELAKGVMDDTQPANAWMSAWMIQQLQTDKDKVDSLA